MNDQKETTLIVGGTGKTGRRVAERLTARGTPVRIASRTGTPPFDWSDPATWAPAVLGVSSIYLAYAPDLAMPEAAARIRAFTELAVAHGTRRIVLLSGRGVSATVPSERAVAESGAAFTILRAAWFGQNFSEGQLLEDVLAGEVAFPAGSVEEPFVDADDIADVAVAALTEDRHAGVIYDLSGPRLLGFAEAASSIAEASGRAVRYVPISPQEYASALSAHIPAGDAAFLSDLFCYVLDGHNAYVGDGVERALGRKARDFQAFVRSAAAAGAWAR